MTKTITKINCYAEISYNDEVAYITIMLNNKQPYETSKIIAIAPNKIDDSTWAAIDAALTTIDTILGQTTNLSYSYPEAPSA